MKYLIGLLILIGGFVAFGGVVILAAFDDRKCVHDFVATELAVIKVERPNLYGGGFEIMPTWPSGLKEGKELICLKCHLKQRQVLDYGEPTRIQGFSVSGWRGVPTDSIGARMGELFTDSLRGMKWRAIGTDSVGLKIWERYKLGSMVYDTVTGRPNGAMFLEGTGRLVRDSGSVLYP